MDINSPISAQSLLASSRLLENPLNLKVGQQLEVKVINADIQAVKNAVTLSLVGKDVTVQSNQPVALSSGQDLKIQVTQVAPVIEFKVLEPLPELKSQAVELRLKLIPTPRDAGSAASVKEASQPTGANAAGVAIAKQLNGPATANAANLLTGKEQMQTPPTNTGSTAIDKPVATDAGKVSTAKEPGQPSIKAAGNQEPIQPTDGENSPAPIKQILDAKIISIAGNKIQLQVFAPPPSPTTAVSNKPAATLITIDRSQLTHAPSDLKAGQNINLEIVKTGAVTEFKIVPPANTIPEAKVAEFVKQFLPRHEAAPIFLNQLIKDLPQLMKNESVPQTLKDIAAKIIRNLPPKEQLVTSQGLKQSIANSGVFLEAKLPPAMSQAELIKELPRLIKNESVPQSLQRIAVEILQNLTQKQPVLNKPSLEQPATTPKPIAETESAPAKLNPVDESNLPKAGALGDAEPLAGDFKGNLLKFIQALKQEITDQTAQPSSQADLDLLKNLQHKTENTVAKLVLDQLASLPKEDNPKQVWIIDIPFIDRQQAESVRIEVQQDKENKQQSGSSNWSVNITITPPELGTIHCIVSYRDDLINTYFKSQNNQTTELIKHNLDYLKNQLEESGLKTGHMDAHAEAQKIQMTHTQQLAGKRLFDDKA